MEVDLVKQDAAPSSATPQARRHRSGRRGARRKAAAVPADWTQRAVGLLGNVLRDGRLEITADDGTVWNIGRKGPCARIRVRDAAVMSRMLLHPALRFGESYMEGEWEPEGSLLEVFEVGLQLLKQIESNPVVQVIRNGTARLLETSGPAASRRNIARHYDLDADFFRLFLDPEMYYSCAYFPSPDATLEQAQRAKAEHIAAKLNLRRGSRVLDIGCGWGGLAIHLAEHHGAEVVGITLSEEQYKVANARAEMLGLRGRVEFRVEDFRETQGSYDAIVSVGMFEHVGRPQYQAYFNRIHKMLKDSGVALVHTIGRHSPPGATNSWITRYIFPGGYIPAASETLQPIERSGLILTDLEVLRLHYARTLSCWHERFRKHRDEVVSRYGERFARMWEFYLQVSEASFRWGDLVVHQYQMVRRQERLPLRREYLYRAG